MVVTERVLLQKGTPTKGTTHERVLSLLFHYENY